MTDDTREMTKQEMSRHLGAALREARLGTGLTQEEVALHVGMAIEVYKRVEKGSMTPGLLSLCTLCTVLELDINAALGLAASKSSTGTKGSESSPEDSPRLRQLMRTLRQLDQKQLALITTVAQGYAKDTRGKSGPS